MATAILVHGGAGPVGDDDGRAFTEGCLAAARAGYAVLQRGGSALDAVVAAAVVLEDDPLFNAGTGAVLNADGEVELDAAVMEGERLLAGAVAAVRTVKNPVLLAREVMARTEHVLLAGPGADAFAREAGFPEVAQETLITQRARARWQKALNERGAPAGGGTIGAVALDARGHVAAGTSTGGTVLKRVGRVGDSPLIGSGTYADDRGGAVSCTGHGEAMIRVVLAKHGREAMAAAEEALRTLDRVGGKGGLILVDPSGGLGFAFNTERMSRAWVHSDRGEGGGFR